MEIVAPELVYPTPDLSKPTAGGQRSVRYADGACIVRPDTIPWTPWALSGTHFKLLWIDRATGMWCAIIYVEPNSHTEPHHHFGAVSVYVLQGDFTYEYGQINTGDAIIEGGSVAHEPIIGPEGMTSISVFMGGISAVGPDGKPTGQYVDCEAMYQMAAANGAADHLPPPPDPRTGSTPIG